MTALRGKRILLVEDEPVIALMVEDMLLDLGAEIVGPAATVGDALELADSGGFDAALLDVNLGGERSHPVADRLRERGIPFVFATGYGSSGADGCAADIVQKPYRQEHIAAALEKALAGR